MLDCLASLYICNSSRVTAFFCSSSRVTAGVIRSFMYARSCANMSVPGSPWSCILSSLTWDSATNRMSKNSSHVVELSITL